jgi:hypothetical protein
MRAVLRVNRYALRTETAYCDWVRRYVKFHRMKSRADLADGTRKVEEFPTHLALEVSTTMIYTHVLQKPGLGVRSPLDG